MTRTVLEIFLAVAFVALIVLATIYRRSWKRSRSRFQILNDIALVADGGRSLEETLEPSQEDGPRKDIGARDLTLSGSVDRVTLERAIENLPPGYRLVFVLHDVEGYEHNEIAGMLECSIGNSKSRLLRLGCCSHK